MIYIIQSNLSIIYMYIHDNIITSATLKYAELPRLCKLPMELLLVKLPNDKGGGGREEGGILSCQTMQKNYDSLYRKF